MGWEAMDNLRELLCKELEEYKKKDKLGMSDLESVNKITDTIKNIDKIEMLEGGEGEYSQSGNSYNNGNSYNGGSSYGMYSRNGNSYGRYSRTGNGYNNGNSYANRGQHYVRGHYSRDAYSQAGEDMVNQLEGMMEGASGEEREVIRRAVDELKRM